MPFSSWILPSLRIRAEEVRAAYLRLRLTPRQNNWSACGWGALGLPMPREEAWSVAETYSPMVPAMRPYRAGFQCGFDEHPYPCPSADGDVVAQPLYRAGYEDGRAAWEAVRDLAEGR